MIDVKSPKTIIAGILAGLALVGGGSFVGFTVEPEAFTEVRISARACEVKVELLEEIVEECRSVVDAIKEAP